jgi:protein kinase C substrate 80K-H
MRRVSTTRVSAVLLLAASLVATAVAGAPVRGVMTELESHYAGIAAGSAETFSCINGKGSGIPANFVNDDYCDCEDGSDEPGTAACTYLGDRFPAQLRFQCTNEGYDKQQLFHSRVNDGICDCCDGSDEFLTAEQGGVSCPNTCAEALAKAKAEKAERERVRQAGLTAKAALVAEAAGSLEFIKKKLAEHTATLAAVDADIAAAEADKLRWEEEEKKEREDIHAMSLKAKEMWEEQQAEKKAAKEAEAAEKKAADEAAAAEKPKAAEVEDVRLSDNHGATPPNVMCTKWRQTGECKGNGPRIPEEDKECDVVIQGGASGFCECVDVRTGLDVEYPVDCGHKPLTCQRMCEHEGKDSAFLPEDGTDGLNNKPAEEEETFTVDTGANHFKTEANEARTKLNDAQNRKRDAENGKKEAEDQLSGSAYGPDNAFLALKGKCFDYNQGHYTYTLCPFDNVRQGGTNMGRWKSWGEQTYGAWGGKHDYSKMVYEDGERCWSGPARSVAVRVVCGETNAILTVDEPSMCTYTMVFQTPAICE